jgi:O-antigen/teichoic acid export membrane protein
VQGRGVLTKLFQRAGAVAVGTGFGQALVLLATPFLARLYSPAEFGSLALLVTVSNISMTVACLRYDIALQTSTGKDVEGLVVVSLVSAAATAVLCVAVALVLSGSHLPIARAAGLLDRPVLVGACVLLVGLHQATSAWMLRSGAYLGVAVMRLSQGGSFGVLAALPGPGLLWSHAVSFGGGLLGAWRILRKRRPPGSRSWTEAARAYRKFPLYSLPGALLDVVGYSMSTWVVASFYGRSAAGEMSQVQRIVGAPLMLMSISLGQILLRHTAELLHERGEIRRLLLRLLRVLAAVAVAALLLLWLAGKPMLALLLGSQWRVDREMIVLVGLSVFVRACVSPLSSALLSLRRFGLALSWQAAYFCSAALVMPWVATRLTFEGYVRFYAAHEAFFYGLYLLLILLAVRDE